MLKQNIVFTFQIIKKFSVEKETLLTVSGFEPGSFDCRSNTLANWATQASDILSFTGRPRYIAFRHFNNFTILVVELKGLESRHSRKRICFHRNLFNYLKIINCFPWFKIEIICEDTCRESTLSDTETFCPEKVDSDISTLYRKNCKIIKMPKRNLMRTSCGERDVGGLCTIAQLAKAVDWQSKDPDSNPGTVESASLFTEFFFNYLKINNCFPWFKSWCRDFLSWKSTQWHFNSIIKIVKLFSLQFKVNFTFLKTIKLYWVFIKIFIVLFLNNKTYDNAS